MTSPVVFFFHALAGGAHGIKPTAASDQLFANGWTSSPGMELSTSGARSPMKGSARRSVVAAENVRGVKGGQRSSGLGPRAIRHGAYQSNEELTQAKAS
jgi:hypothetical protein